MKKLWLLSPLFGLIWSACSNEFEVAAPYKDIPVVYAIISPDDTAHYIRIERVFIDPDKSAYDVARIPDSIYYAENAITVFLERVSTGDRFQMSRVDGNLEGHEREPGAYAQSPNWLYKVKPSQVGAIVKSGEKYKLVIERADGRPPVTAETTVPNVLTLVLPDPFGIPQIIAFSEDDPTKINWRTSPSAVIFDVYLNIRYRELSAAPTVTDTIRWRAAKGIIRENNPVSGGVFVARTSITAQAFYQTLLDNIDTQADVQRYFNGIDLEFQGAGPEIVEYQEVAAINGGLTGAEISTRYTNLSEGFGIFTAKKTWRFNNFQLNPASLEELNSDPTRRNLLKFKG